MSRFTPETIERVREAADIVEIVSAYTDLRRQGERFVGLCPFHDERTPSFSVKPRDGFYYCFGCEAGGDTIRFVQEKEGLGVPGRRRGARRALRGRGRARDRGSEGRGGAAPPRPARRGARAGRRLLRVLPLGVAEGRRRPATYLIEERGLGEEVLRSFGVGFAPERLGLGPDPRPARRLLGRRAARRRADPALAEEPGQPLRPLPRPGSRSRSATIAAASSASAPAGWAPTPSRST